MITIIALVAGAWVGVAGYLAYTGLKAAGTVCTAKGLGLATLAKWNWPVTLFLPTK